MTRYGTSGSCLYDELFVSRSPRQYHRTSTSHHAMHVPRLRLETDSHVLPSRPYFVGKFQCEQALHHTTLEYYGLESILLELH